MLLLYFEKVVMKNIVISKVIALSLCSVYCRHVTCLINELEFGLNFLFNGVVNFILCPLEFEIFNLFS